MLERYLCPQQRNRQSSERVCGFAGLRVSGYTAGKPANRLTNNGSILIVVLWSLFFLSALAVAIRIYVEPQLDLAGRLNRKAAMYYLAAAGVKRAVLELENDETTEFDALSDLWSDEETIHEMALGEGNFSVGIVDEERKVNINKASREILKNLFEMAAELEPDEAGALADSVIDWRDEDDEPGDEGAEDWYYSTLHPPYSCKNADFETIEELFLVKGVTHEIFDCVRDLITVYGDGAVNINTADEKVLRILGMEEELVEKILQFRQEGAYGTEEYEGIFTSAEHIASVLDSAIGLSATEINRINRIFGLGFLTVVSDNFMGNSIGWLTEIDGSASITFVYNRKDKTVKYWHER